MNRAISAGTRSAGGAWKWTLGCGAYTTRFGLAIGDDRLQWELYDRALLLTIAEEIGLTRRAAEGVLTELGKRKPTLERRLEQGLRLDEGRSWAYRASVAAAWERIDG
jgi:hypothetical protein